MQCTPGGQRSTKYKALCEDLKSLFSFSQQDYTGDYRFTADNDICTKLDKQDGLLQTTWT